MVVIKYPLSSRSTLCCFYLKNLSFRIDVTGQNFIQVKIFGSCVICAPRGQHIGRHVDGWLQE